MVPYSECGKSVIKNKFSKSKQLLILADELGKGLNMSLRKYEKLQNYEISSFIKPNATLTSVMQGMDKSTMNFTIDDYVLVMGGSNDIKNRAYPSFKNICVQLKKCNHTNIIVSSIPYSKNDVINNYIFKFNSKLNELIRRLNRVTEGNIIYYEINNTMPKKKLNIANNIADTVTNAKNTKGLIFIPTNCNKIDIAKSTQIEGRRSYTTSDIPQNIGEVPLVIEVIDEVIEENVILDSPIEESINCIKSVKDPNFLYPNLLEITFAT